jgi:WhiB family redox-sensing transcriptional regulator
MSSLTTDQTWRHRAACFGLDVNLFFPDKGQVPQEIKAICEACPVKAECLEYALSVPQTADLTGIFAGTSARQRRKMRLNQQTVPPETTLVLVWDAEAGKYRSVRA